MPFETEIQSALCIDANQMDKDDSILVDPMNRIAAGVYPVYYNKLLQIIER